MTTHELAKLLMTLPDVTITFTELGEDEDNEGNWYTTEFNAKYPYFRFDKTNELVLEGAIEEDDSSNSIFRVIWRAEANELDT